MTVSSDDGAPRCVRCGELLIGGARCLEGGACVDGRVDVHTSPDGRGSAATSLTEARELATRLAAKAHDLKRAAQTMEALSWTLSAEVEAVDRGERKAETLAGLPALTEARRWAR